jgi:hypothetical protein
MGQACIEHAVTVERSIVATNSALFVRLFLFHGINMTEHGGTAAHEAVINDDLTAAAW